MNAILARKIHFGSNPQQKYRNKPTEVDGLKFDSKKEAKRWGDLKTLEKAGRIKDLHCRGPGVIFKLEVAGKLICRYIADFAYKEDQKGEWVQVIEDAKGYPTPIYKLKRKLMEACHDIIIRET